MAEEIVGQRESIVRKPVRSSQEYPTALLHEAENKENFYRKPGPIIPRSPGPDAGRLHDAPMSPVRINVQNEGWPPRPSSATIENMKASASQMDNAYSSEEALHPLIDPSMIQRISHGQNFTMHVGEPVQEAQAAYVTSSVDRTSAASSINAPSGQDPPSRDSSSWESRSSQPSNEIQQVQPLQYHHQQLLADEGGFRSGPENNRHLTPRSTVLRPSSAYSAMSDPDARGRSPGNLSHSGTWNHRSTSGHLVGRSPDNRKSYVDLLNVPYPQPAPVPLSLDNSQLRSNVGTNASLLSTAKTLEMYRMNVKKTNDASVQYAFAVFLISAAQEAAAAESVRDLDGPSTGATELASSSQELLLEARQILRALADKSYPFAQYYLADGYASGLFNKGKEDHDRAFPLFVAASKHGHAESGYRAALCYEFGWGTKKDPAKAVQFYRQSASKNHPGAMTRLGRACLTGELGLNKYREGIKWLKRATEAADLQYNAAPYHLGLLYENGYGDDIFKDETYAAQLFTQAADLGHSEASYRMGDAYEHGKLSCPRDPALSVHFYTGAAQKGHAGAMMALCAWYMVGAEPVMEKDENEAYEWARRAAELGM
jgi:TPR repeat protein